MKNQALFSHEKSSLIFFERKDKSKILKCRLLQFLFGALRVRIHVLATNFAIGPQNKDWSKSLIDSFNVTYFLKVLPISSHF